MELSQVASAVSLVVSLISIASLVYSAGKQAARIESLEKFADGLKSIVVDVVAISTKMDTIWDHYTRRAFAEVVHRGYGTMGSPLEVNIRGEIALKALSSELKSWYASVKGANMSDSELMLEIEKKYGKRIVEEVCVPQKMTHGACLVLALAVAKGEMSLEMP